MPDRNSSTTATTMRRIDRIDAAINNGREAIQRKNEKARRARRGLARTALLILFGGVLTFLTILLLGLKLAHAIHRHPAIAAAGSLATAGAIIVTAILLPIVGPHRHHHGALPARPTLTRPAPPRPTPTPSSPPGSPGKPTTRTPVPSAMTTAAPVPSSIEASTSASPPTISLPISPPEVSMPPQRHNAHCQVQVNVGRIRVSVPCEYRSPVNLRPLLDAKQDVSWW